MKITREELRKIIREQLTLNLRNNTSWERWVREFDEYDDEVIEDKDEEDDSESK